ncbi:hypothetical protein HDV57DRAFT_65553 [Trichoderma longibrachiatum]|uniref:Uncharacterized protein n=1 Tax=Trichoderma longibrachiatum ATCC 18648 TaxID=983965 RepID=A0A2T4CF53_TRILO|nr:hypothetical protein M440DRAFT_182775 [Trichoderma longibrachiatum ATCC 18648]
MVDHALLPLVIRSHGIHHGYNTSQMLPYIHAFAFVSTCAHLICAKHSHPEHSINTLHLHGISSPSHHLEAAVNAGPPPTPYAARFAPPGSDSSSSPTTSAALNKKKQEDNNSIHHVSCHQALPQQAATSSSNTS